MIDGCPFNPVFDDKVDADLFTRRFPKGSTIYVNPPFSDPNAFLLRCFILWAYFGHNVILLIPTGKYQAFEFAHEFIKPAVREVCLAPISFRGYGYT